MSIDLLGRHVLQNALFLAHAANACYDSSTLHDKGFKTLVSTKSLTLHRMKIVCR